MIVAVRTKALVWGALASVALYGCAEAPAPLTCGEGTSQVESQCVSGTSPDPNNNNNNNAVTCGPGTVQSGTQCVPDSIGPGGNITAPPGQKLASGGAHVCVLGPNGAIKCWGQGGDGQLGDGRWLQSGLPVTVIAAAPTDAGTNPLTGAVAVVAGDEHTCLLMGNGSVRCFGSNNQSQLGNGTPDYFSYPTEVLGLAPGATAISSGQEHTCALVLDGVRCWGSNDNGQLGFDPDVMSRSAIARAVPGLETGVTAIAAGAYHTCARLSDGKVKCLGDNNSGQLGVGTTLQKFTPQEVLSLADTTHLFSASYRTFAIVDGGMVKGWGLNDYGEVGVGQSGQVYAPTEATELAGAVQLTGGEYFACATMANGSVKCVGYNDDGQLGNGSFNDSATVVDVASVAGAQEVRAGNAFTCALLGSGAVKCWGRNSDGQLGNGFFAEVVTPRTMGVSDLTQMSIANNHGCGLVNDGGLRCWGDNGSGQLGNGTYSQVDGLVDVTGLSGAATAVSVGDSSSTCAIVGGAAQCWGSNGNGRLGTGNYNTYNVPTAVAVPSGTVEGIAAGPEHGCAIVAGSLYCWGYNGYGQLGNGNQTTTPTPVQVTGLTSGVTHVAAGQYSTCAVHSGAAKCWGYNSTGQVGPGNNTSPHTSPQQVSGLTSGVTKVAVGDHHACAIHSGAAKCWGQGYNAELGHGVNTQVNTPVQVTGLTSGVTDLFAGRYHTCVIHSGELKCWGRGQYGALGNGDNWQNYNTPQTVMLPAVPTLLGRGSYSGAAFTSMGIYGWGANWSGQLPLGVSRVSSTAVDVLGLQ